MIIIVGAAGSGKSTQSQLLVANGKYQALSVGELLRREISGPDALIMESGQLLDDETVIDYVKAELAKIGDSPEVILDGFPRSAYQANWILNASYPLRALVHIKINRDVAKSRLLDRGRSDDYEDAIIERFGEYEATSSAIIEHIKDSGLPVLTVDGNSESLILFEEITHKLATI